MECPHCDSPNMTTFKMAHASYNVGINSWNGLVKLMLFGPLGLFMKPHRNSVAGFTAPPEKPFPILAGVFGFLFFSTLTWLVSIYLRRGLEYPETQTALWVNAVMLVVAFLVARWDIIRCVKARKAYPELLDKWVHSWICLQCGKTYEIRDLPRDKEGSGDSLIA